MQGHAGPPAGLNPTGNAGAGPAAAAATADDQQAVERAVWCQCIQLLQGQAIADWVAGAKWQEVLIAFLGPGADLEAADELASAELAADIAADLLAALREGGGGNGGGSGCANSHAAATQVGRACTPAGSGLCCHLSCLTGDSLCTCFYWPHNRLLKQPRHCVCWCPRRRLPPAHWPLLQQQSAAFKFPHHSNISACCAGGGRPWPLPNDKAGHPPGMPVDRGKGCLI